MCDGQNIQVATLEDGSASVYLPVENWRDVKAVRTEPDLGAAVQALLADNRLQIYGAPGALMVNVCIDFLSDEEKQARDQAEADAAKASVAEVHDAHVEAAQASVSAAENDLAVEQEQGDAENDLVAQAIAEREAQVEAARKALADAEAARDSALQEVRQDG